MAKEIVNQFRCSHLGSQQHWWKKGPALAWQHNLWEMMLEATEVSEIVITEQRNPEETEDVM